MSLKLTVIRGLPGSGKSTLAKTIDAMHYEADMFFTDKCGRYHFDVHRIREAHRWCQMMTKRALSENKSVVVSNTFIELWEIKPYYRLAEHFSAQFQVIECSDCYGSIHDVPESVVSSMRKRWQPWCIEPNLG